VHRNLGLPRAVNDALLCVVELLALRSGHAYQAAHLHHNARYPHPDDIEASAARRSWIGALAEGPAFQHRLWLWALRNAAQARAWVVGEGIVLIPPDIVHCRAIPCYSVLFRAIHSNRFLPGTLAVKQ
jgi:beta-carotene hydroxylase